MPSYVDLGPHIHFYGTVRIVCSFCDDARGFRITWDQNQMIAAGPDYIGKKIHECFERLEKQVRDLSWVFDGNKWFCGSCVDKKRDQ